MLSKLPILHWGLDKPSWHGSQTQATWFEDPASSLQLWQVHEITQERSNIPHTFKTLSRRHLHINSQRCLTAAWVIMLVAVFFVFWGQKSRARLRFIMVTIGWWPGSLLSTSTNCCTFSVISKGTVLPSPRNCVWWPTGSSNHSSKKVLPTRSCRIQYLQASQSEGLIKDIPWEVCNLGCPINVTFYGTNPSSIWGNISTLHQDITKS